MEIQKGDIFTCIKEFVSGDNSMDTPYVYKVGERYVVVETFNVNPGLEEEMNNNFIVWIKHEVEYESDTSQAVLSRTFFNNFDYRQKVRKRKIEKINNICRWEV